MAAPPPPFPALYLLPLDNSFFPPKRIQLVPGAIVRIGRQLNAKSLPSADNGVFESRVLSRQHAEVWFEPAGSAEGDEQADNAAGKGRGRVMIRDVKSSNGTFVNGERLSPENVESGAFEVRSDDILEFGIDILGEEGQVIHRKVAARATCALTELEAQRAVRAEQRMFPPAVNPNAQQQHQQSPSSPSSASPSQQHSPGGPLSVSFAVDVPALRRPQGPGQQGGATGQQGPAAGLAGMGGMGTERIRPKSGDFDSILARLRDGPRAGVREAFGLQKEGPQKKQEDKQGKPAVPVAGAESKPAVTEPAPTTDTKTTTTTTTSGNTTGTTITTLDTLRTQLAETRKQLDEAVSSSANIFITPDPHPAIPVPAPETSSGGSGSTLPPPIVTNARLLSEQLTRLREEVGALQRLRTGSGARSRRRRRRETPRRVVNAPPPVVVTHLHAEPEREEEGEEDTWEDLGLDASDLPRYPMSPNTDTVVPDSPLVWVGAGAGYGSGDTSAPSSSSAPVSAPANASAGARRALQSQLDVLEERIGRLVGDLGVMRGVAGTREQERERDVDGDVPTLPALAPLVARVDELEERASSAAAPSTSASVEEKDSREEGMKSALQASMRALQVEWGALRAEFAGFSALSASVVPSGNGQNDVLARWLLDDASATTPIADEGGQGHGRDSSNASSDSEVGYVFPGRYARAWMVRDRDAMVGSVGVLGLLTPAGSVSVRGLGFGQASVTPAPIPALPSVPAAATPVAAAEPSRDHTGNGHVPELSTPAPHLARGRFGKLLTVKMSTEEALLVLGALGAGVAIVGAAWMGA
ncbi:Monocarboxylate transporter [Mycena chlorophos]|uniref:Monocarboxylate transporter n=1 Tax=Mycena chlorophos TaxID=658473 RepID=A0A8H6SU92_MYCCL|nr:Monocarboxylate transporter [Mycena chlorophos]